MTYMDGSLMRFLRLLFSVYALFGILLLSPGATQAQASFCLSAAAQENSIAHATPDFPMTTAVMGGGGYVLAIARQEFNSAVRGLS